MSRTTGGPPRLVEAVRIPLKKPEMLQANLSFVKVLVKPKARGIAKKIVTPPISTFSVEGAIIVIIQIPIGIPKRLLPAMGAIPLRYTFLKL